MPPRRLIIIALFFAGLFWPVSVPAQTPPACTGKDLIGELKLRDPAAYERLKAEAAKIPNGDSVFWRIDGPPGTKPSWLFGTIQSSDRRLVPVRLPFALALERAGTVAVESLQRDISPKEGETDAKMEELPQGRSLLDFLDEYELKQLRKRLKAIGSDLNEVAPLQPWVVANIILYPPCEVARFAAGLDSLDQAIVEKAKALGSLIVPLDGKLTKNEKFAATPFEYQIANLKAVLHSPYGSEDDAETLLQAWIKGAPALYHAFSNTSGMPDEESDVWRMNDTALDHSNMAMRDGALPHLKEGNLFISVGALHLFGENGLVELLRKAGYKVTPVK